jgi:phosphoribosylglycinamide formyltransferase-1
MVSLVEGMRAGEIRAEPAVVISNRPKAAGLQKAAEFGIPTEVISHKKIKPRKEHERHVIEALHKHRVDLVCLAGYMRLLSPLMVQEFRNRIFNIHPSLLPAFPGLDVQQQALDYGVKFSGCTVHIVDEECDHGPIVRQAVVPILEDDTADSLAARILEQEHRIYKEAVALYFEGRLRVDGRVVHIDDPGQ